MTGKYRIRKLIKDKGFQINAQVDVVLEEDAYGIEIEVFENSKWACGVNFGAKYFYDKYSTKFRNKLKVKLILLDTHPVDTTNILVAFAISKCLCDALDFEIDSLVLNDSGIFQLPR